VCLLFSVQCNFLVCYLTDVAQSQLVLKNVVCEVLIRLL